MQKLSGLIAALFALLVCTAEQAQVHGKSVSYMVFCDFDSSTIDTRGVAVIKAAADVIKQVNGRRAFLTGHTDTAGSADYNLALSLRRAVAVKDVLIREGVPAEAVIVKGVGLLQPLVQTGPEVREPQNRRVEFAFNR